MTRPPCQTPGCTSGDCPTCRYIDEMETRLSLLQEGLVAAQQLVAEVRRFLRARGALR